MKKLICLFIVGLFLVMMGCQKDSWFDISVPDFDQKDKAVTFRNSDDEMPLITIDKGVDWLVGQKNADGSFGAYDKVTQTALVVTKLCDRSIELLGDTKSGLYANIIAEGLDYIFSQAKNVSGESGLVFTTGGHETYNTGIALMAIAAFRYPGDVVNVGNVLVDGKTHLDVAKLGVEFFKSSQNADGGWRYDPTWTMSDQSNTGFAVLGLLASEQFGCEIAEDIKTKLSLYIDYTQNDVDGEAKDGGCGYTADNDWVNVLKTGNLLFEMAFVGDDGTSGRVGDAIDYIERHWDAPGGDGGSLYTGWKENRYLAMYCLMKGFQSLGVKEITIDGELVPRSWYGDFKTRLVAQQNVDGSWPAVDPWLSSDVLSTAFNLLTLERITPVPFITVEFDIKPTSCPNPFNLGSKGVLPVAILGTEDFDVSQIDLSSITFEGVSPLRSSMEDVTAPVVDPQEDCECTTAGPDGFMDLTLKFDRQELVNAEILEDVVDGDVVEMTITGKLYDGKAFVGKDCIRVLKKGKK